MNRFDGSGDAEMLLNPVSSALVKVTPLKGAYVLWRPQHDLTDAALLDSTAFEVAKHGVDGSDAYADRYGGAGIGNHGGSGRGVIIDRLFIKGVGRTPLVGRSADETHSNGFSYLEEAVREGVFAEIFAAELPYGAVKTVAIIGSNSVAAAGSMGTLRFLPYRVLVARPAVLRPAHFERAAYYNSNQAFAGELDEARVAQNLLRVGRTLGRFRFLFEYASCWCRWAEQSAYQLIHRLLQTQPSTSNIALDGRLLDFGGARAVADWRPLVPAPQRKPIGTEIDQVLSYLRQGGLDVLAREIGNQARARHLCAKIAQRCVAQYNRRVGVEVMRLLGFRSRTILEWCGIDDNERRLSHAVSTMLAHARRFLSYDNTDWPQDEFRWDLWRVLDQPPPRHLLELNQIYAELARTALGEPLAMRSALRMLPRRALHYNVMQDAMHYAFTQRLTMKPSDSEIVSEFIGRNIVIGRRDSRLEPRHAYGIGFAHGPAGNVAFFSDGNREFALNEAESRHRLVPVEIREREYILDGRDAVEAHICVHAHLRPPGN